MKMRSQRDGSVDHRHKLYVRRAQLTAELLFHGKWQIEILCAMRHGSVRIGQLGRLIPAASKKVLTQSLRRLEANGVVVRRDLSELVLHVEYEVHADIREGLGDLLDSLSNWGAHFLEMESDSAALRNQNMTIDPKH